MNSKLENDRILAIARYLHNENPKANNRPRKCLGYKTPREVFEEEISVALAN